MTYKTTQQTLTELHSYRQRRLRSRETHIDVLHHWVHINALKSNAAELCAEVQWASRVATFVLGIANNNNNKKHKYMYTHKTHALNINIEIVIYWRCMFRLVAQSLIPWCARRVYSLPQLGWSFGITLLGTSALPFTHTHTTHLQIPYNIQSPLQSVQTATLKCTKHFS